jgi:hypothetical protein
MRILGAGIPDNWGFTVVDLFGFTLIQKLSVDCTLMKLRMGYI